LARIYKRKPDALVAKLTVPMSDDLLRRLREHAEAKEQTPTAAAREIISQALPEPVK
jgi:predicted transcriptional regulator